MGSIVTRECRFIPASIRAELDSNFCPWMPGVTMRFYESGQKQRKRRSRAYEHSRASGPARERITNQPFDTVIARIDEQIGHPASYLASYANSDALRMARDPDAKNRTDTD
jgi:hypothetical protein